MTWIATDIAGARKLHQSRVAIGKAQDLIEQLLRARKPAYRVTKEQAALLCEVEEWLTQALDRGPA